MFGLERAIGRRATAPFFLTEGATLMVNASSGLWLLIQILSPPQVWLPSYLCGSLTAAVSKAGVRAKFYEISSTLRCTSRDWLAEVKTNDLIVSIDYFGFPMDDSWVAEARSKGARILEDASQALLSRSVGRQADFVLFSPRKFLGVPDGGILLWRQNQPATNHLELFPPPSDWWRKALQASELRRAFDLGNTDRQWFHLFQETERDQPVGPYAMSQLSRDVLKHGIDYPVIAQKRCENYRYLLRKLHHLAIFPELPEGVVPLGFPIRVAERDRIREELFDAAIYPPIHWSLKEVVPARFRASHDLADHIMTLPCDQRYGLEDMIKMVDTVSALL